MAANILDHEFASTFETVEKQEEQRLRSIITENPLDFDTWLDLVKHIEKYVIARQKIPELNTQIYREILKEYPLCYGFWRKLADIYSVRGEEEQVISLYEESFSYLPVCVEL